MSSGPQPDGRAALPVDPPRAPGTWLLVVPIVLGVAGFLLGRFVLLVVAVLASRHDRDALTAVGVAAALLLLAAAGTGSGCGGEGTGW